MSESARIPHTHPSVWPKLRPDRFAAQLRCADPSGCQIALLGIPDDTGVRLNGGRIGARLGPSAFREALAQFGTDFDGANGHALDARVFDCGDLEVASGDDASALEETHTRVTAATRRLHELDLIPFVVGGGHDLTCAAVAGLVEGRALGASRELPPRAPLGAISLDAHLDVRENIGSGMPFRRSIEAHRLDPGRFAVWGASPFANAQGHHAWALERGVRILHVEQVLADAHSLDRAFEHAFPTNDCKGFVTLCLDGLDETFAPGVSAPSPMGLTPLHAAALARRAGADPRVLHFDLMELCPRHDRSQRTARLAAFLFLCFVSAFGTRPR